MPRMRTLKPEAATSETLASVPRAVRWTFGLLWTHCDDEGRCILNPKLIKAAIYPLDDDVTTDVLLAEIDQLERSRSLCVYEVAGRQYLHVPSWHEHQHPNRRVASKLPPCPGGDGEGHVQQSRDHASPTTHAQRSERAVSTHEQLIPVVVVEGRVDGEGDGDGAATNVEPHATAPRPPALIDSSVNQRAQRLTTAYTDRVPLSRFPAILGITKRAIQSGRYSDQQIHDALIRLAAEGRSVTVETLRIELDGQPPTRQRPPTAADKVRGYADAAEQAKALIRQSAQQHALPPGA